MVLRLYLVEDPFITRMELGNGTHIVSGAGPVPGSNGTRQCIEINWQTKMSGRSRCEDCTYHEGAVGRGVRGVLIMRALWGGVLGVYLS